MTELGRVCEYMLWGIEASSGVLASIPCPCLRFVLWASGVIEECGQSVTGEVAEDLEGYCRIHVTTILASASLVHLAGVPQNIRTEDFTGHRVRPVLKVDHSGVTSNFRSNNSKLLQNLKDL